EVIPCVGSLAHRMTQNRYLPPCLRRRATSPGPARGRPELSELPTDRLPWTVSDSHRQQADRALPEEERHEHSRSWLLRLPEQCRRSVLDCRLACIARVAEERSPM